MIELTSKEKRGIGCSQDGGCYDVAFYKKGADVKQEISELGAK